MTILIKGVRLYGEGEPVDAGVRRADRRDRHRLVGHTEIDAAGQIPLPGFA